MTTSPRTPASPATGPTSLGRVVLTLDVLALVGCVVLAGFSFADTESSTSGIGLVVAVFLAVPFLLSAVLVLVAHRAEPPGRTVLLGLATFLCVALAGLVGLQLLLGS